MAVIETVPDRATPSLRARKVAAATSIVDDIPLAHPGDLPPRSDSTSPLLSPSRSRSPSLSPSEIDEALRSGRLPNPLRAAEEEERERDGSDVFFDTAIYVIPFTSLYLLLDIMVYLQYSFRPKLPDLLSHLARALPTLSVIIWYTNKHAAHWATNPLLMSTSLMCGARAVWLFNKGSWGVVTAQAPAMGTLWILTIVQLPLGRAVLCLMGVAGWCWWNGMKLST